MKKPIIGITLDWEPSGEYSVFPHYALRENYASAVAAAGGVPLMLPHVPEMAKEMINLLDGLVITGGNFDIDPSYYGVEQRHQTVTTKDKRTAFEVSITKKALERHMPILGICGGQQLLNVILGGSLIQHIPDAVDNALEHEQKHTRTEPGHTVTITPDTLLHHITGQTELAVNTSHHQAVATVAPDVLVNAVAPDGVIEGIEYSKHPFCLGVQWHPEYEISDGDSRIFQAFVQATRK
jgi:putative glutamine amidotransferase